MRSRTSVAVLPSNISEGEGEGSVMRNLVRVRVRVKVKVKVNLRVKGVLTSLLTLNKPLR